MPSTPHYLLFAESGYSSTAGPSWRFLLQDVSTQHRLVVTDYEPDTCGERLELLAVVRGLEAIDGPARVTLVTKSRYVSRGLKSGLAEWRTTGWQWERFGRIVPVKDHDLWQRVDRALQFHEVDCEAWIFGDGETAEVTAPPQVAERCAAEVTCRSTSSRPPAFGRQRRRRGAIARPEAGTRAAWGKMGRKIMAWVDGPGPSGRLVASAT